MSTPTRRGSRARRWSHSTPGRIAAAMMKPRKSRAMTTLIFQSASASDDDRSRRRASTIAARAAVVLISRDPALSVEAFNPDASHPDERVVPRFAAPRRRPRPAARRGRSRSRSSASTGFALGWPVSVAGAVLLVVAAVVALAAVWQLGPHARRPDDREALRRPRRRAPRQAAAVHLARVGASRSTSRSSAASSATARSSPASSRSTASPRPLERGLVQQLAG